jgi:sugar lactone lactonase YvrE
MKHPTSLLCGLALAALALTGGCAGTRKQESTEPVFYPPAPEEPRLQWLGRFSSSTDLKEVSGFRRLVAGDEATRWVGRAHGIAYANNRLYVCDPGMSTVTVFDLEKRDVFAMDAKDEHRVKKPIEIAIAPDGWKYVTCTHDRRVYVYDADDKYRTHWGDPEKWRPVGIAATGDHVFVSDVANHAIVVLDRRTGDEIRRIGKEGKQEGEFYYPVALAIGPSGDLYVTDSFNCRVQRLTPEGEFVSSVGQPGKRLGDFARPKGVAVDRDGRIYAVDASFANCQIFDGEGRLLLFFAQAGTESGSVNLPADVEVSYAAVPMFRDKVAPGYDIDYVVFITSHTGIHKVNAYGLLRKK